MGEEEASCPGWGSGRLERLVSRFALARSEEDRVGRLAEPSVLGDVNEHDPKSVARFMKRTGQELGEEAGEEFDRAIAEMQRGGVGDSPEAETRT